MCAERAPEVTRNTTKMQRDVENILRIGWLKGGARAPVVCGGGRKKEGALLITFGVACALKMRGRREGGNRL